MSDNIKHSKKPCILCFWDIWRIIKKNKNIICFKCGKNGHYTNVCNSKYDINGRPIENIDKGICNRCGSTSHNTYNCYAITL